MRVSRASMKSGVEGTGRRVKASAFMARLWAGIFGKTSGRFDSSWNGNEGSRRPWAWRSSRTRKPAALQGLRLALARFL
jgi:hypothetical protein